MKILIIGSGFPPFEFSENIINGKLALALIKAGHNVQVITRTDDGKLYNDKWAEPWLSLLPYTHIIDYQHGGILKRSAEILRSIIRLKYPLDGIRWAFHACKKAEELLKKESFDVILTRSPNDVSHLPGLWLKRKYKIRWIANWNDPASPVWPEPYKQELPFWKKMVMKKFVQDVLDSADISTFPSIMLALHFRKTFRINSGKTSIVPHLMMEFDVNEPFTDNSENLYLCHSGNISDERDPGLLLQAITEINSKSDRKIFFEVIGVVSEKYMPLLNSPGLMEYIKITSPLPYYQALKRMSSFDALVIIEAQMDQSIFLPSKISDYIQFCPVLSLSPRVSELSNMFREYGGGIIAENRSFHDIKQKLLSLLELKSEKKLMDAFDRNSLKNHLSHERIARLYTDLISK